MQSSDASSPVEGVNVASGVGVWAGAGVEMDVAIGVGFRVGVVGVSAATIDSGPDPDGPPVEPPSHPAMTNKRQMVANIAICIKAVILHSTQTSFRV